MKRVFLLIVVPALLVAMGFAQTPAASGSADPINIKGCLGGSEGNYTILEDNTGKIVRITTSSADLKAYLGQDVNLTGHKAGPADKALPSPKSKWSPCTVQRQRLHRLRLSAPAETINTPPAAAAAPAGCTCCDCQRACRNRQHTRCCHHTCSCCNCPDARECQHTSGYSHRTSYFSSAMRLPQLHPRPPVRLREDTPAAPQRRLSARQRRLPAHPLPPPLFTERGFSSTAETGSNARCVACSS